MKFSLVVLSVVLAILFDGVTSQTVSCETIRTDDYGYGSLKTCYMTETTSIDLDEVVISPVNSSVEAIDFYVNKKIHFLPIRVAESFTNLVLYFASGCSIKTVSKKNLKLLKKLKYLNLNFNQIERINSDTFEDLVSLEHLYLHNNRIKEINGAALGGLNRLTFVDLLLNACIDRDSNKDYNQTAFATLITEKCGFTEVEETTENIPNLVQSLNVSMIELVESSNESSNN